MNQKYRPTPLVWHTTINIYLSARVRTSHISMNFEVIFLNPLVYMMCFIS